MQGLKINEIANILNGRLINCSENLNTPNIAMQSQYVKPGDLYICVIDKSEDVLTPVKRAVKKGAIAVITPKETDCSIPQIIVDDTWSALETLARYYRSQFNSPAIMVTGSSGKTSTKGLIATVLGEKFNVHKTPGNNNLILGVTYTAFTMNSNHQFSVFEAGMYGPGQIRKAANAVRPDIAVITNISTAHIQSFGTKENILKEKMDVTAFFNENNILILNADDEYLATVKDKPYRIIKTSLKGNGEYNATDIVNLGEAGVQFKCYYKGKECLFELPVPGVHNVSNALAAIVVADLYDLDYEQVRQGLSKFETAWLRMNVLSLKSNIKIIADCYNANVASMKAGLDTISTFTGGRKIAVLGDMLELGDLSEGIHREIGKYLIGKCDLLITVGNASEFIHEEAKNHVECVHFETKAAAVQYLENIIREQDIIFVKGSSDMNMDKIVDSLVEYISKKD